MDQKQRTETLKQFKDNEIQLLVCSDVAARGIDVSDISHVFNYDVPMSADDYVHRIGRTGRAGKEGRTWMLATKYDDKFVDAIKKLSKTDEIEVVDLNGDGKVEPKSKPKPKPEPKKTAKQPSQKGDDSDKNSPPTTRRKPSKYDNKPNTRMSDLRDNNDDDGDGVTGFGGEIPNFFK